MQIGCLPTNPSRKSYQQQDIQDTLTGAICTAERDVRLRVIDLNDDCLEEIFRHLNLRQLFDVATVHTRFMTACRRALLKGYRNREITISVYHTFRPNYPLVLRLIGDIIRHLRITYDRCDDHGHENFNNTIHDAIVQHCSNTLTEITFNHILPTMELDRPFEHLESLNFNQGRVGVQMSQFNKWFPNLVSVQFFFCTTTDTDCIEHTFPKLLHFTVAHQNFTFDNLRTFLDFNQQLKSFTVYNYDVKLIRRLEAYTKAKFHSLQTKYEIYPCYFAFNND